MGITQFAKTHRGAGKQVRIEDYRGKSVIFDTTGRVAKHCYGIRANKGKDKVNEKGDVISHLDAIMCDVLMCLKHEITPVGVFDGSKTDLKVESGCYEKRSTVRKDAEAKCKELEAKKRTDPEYEYDSTEEDEYKRSFKKSTKITSRQWRECVELYKATGLPCVVAPEEGDPQCAVISQYTGFPVVTDDTDILIYLGTEILRFWSSKEPITKFALDDILKNLLKMANEMRHRSKLPDMKEITHENFVDFSILMGSDYMKLPIKNIDNMDLLKYMAVNDFDVHLVVDELKKDGYIVAEDIVDKCSKIKSHYLADAVCEHPERINYNTSAPNRSRLIEIMCVDNSYPIHEIDALYIRLLKHHESPMLVPGSKSETIVIRSDPSLYRTWVLSPSDTKNKKTLHPPKSRKSGKRRDSFMIEDAVSRSKYADVLPLPPAKDKYTIACEHSVPSDFDLDEMLGIGSGFKSVSKTTGGYYGGCGDYFESLTMGMTSQLCAKA
jgi:5'-3' exonuclease